MVLSASLDSCRFKHDRAKARKEGRCLACGQKDHFRPECPNVAPENRVVQDSAVSPEASPKAGQPGGKGGRAKVKAKALPRQKALLRMGPVGLRRPGRFPLPFRQGLQEVARMHCLQRQRSCLRM